MKVYTMRYKEVIEAIEKIAPPHLTESWDNSGVQIYTGKNEIFKLMVCLEVTEKTVKEAVEKNADLVFCHHPLIFNPIKSVDILDGDFGSRNTSKQISELIKHDICVYSAHLTFDNAPKGNNWYLAQLLELSNITNLHENPVIPGSVGFLQQQVTLEEFCTLVSRELRMPIESIRFVGKQDTIIKKVGICTGAGADGFYEAKKANCQVFLTGDVKYHQAVVAKAAGIAVVDAGHFATEKIFSENAAKQLLQMTEGRLEIVMATSEKDPFTFVNK